MNLMSASMKNCVIETSQDSSIQNMTFPEEVPKAIRWNQRFQISEVT